MGLSNSRVVFDTNMLLAVPQFKVDVFSRVREKLGRQTAFFVPKSVLEELQRIAEKGKKYERNVVVVMEAIEKNEVKEIGTVAGNADSALLELSKQGFYVASNDRVLRKKIKMLGGKNIYLRKKKLIKIE